MGSPGQANYASAKEGMVGLARALAAELASYGITINAIYPGGATRMADAVPQSTQDMHRERAKAAAEQAGIPFVEAPPGADDPENNAPKTVYLCTEAGGSITGQVIGTSGLPMKLYYPRHVVGSIHKNGRWTLDELDKVMPATLGGELRNPVPPEPPRK